MTWPQDIDIDNEDEDCDYGNDETLDICESYCNCTNSNPRPNPCADQLHSRGVFGKKFENKLPIPLVKYVLGSLPRWHGNLLY